MSSICEKSIRQARTMEAVQTLPVGHRWLHAGWGAGFWLPCREDYAQVLPGRGCDLVVYSIHGWAGFTMGFDTTAWKPGLP